MDPVSASIAGYAAIVSTVALGWQIHTYRAARKPGIEVRLALSALIFDDPLWVVMITAANNGQRPIGVDGGGLLLQDGSGRTMVPTRMQPAQTIPGTVEPGHSVMTYLEKELLERNGIDLTKPLVGFVTLASGTRVTSRPIELMSR
jgi:hypothetical protein